MQAGKLEKEGDASPQAPPAPLKPAKKTKRKSRWDEFEDGTLAPKPVVDETKQPQRIKPEKVEKPSKAPRVAGKFGPAPGEVSYSYGDTSAGVQLDPARVAYNQQVAHLKKNLVYKSILPGL